MNFIQVLLLLLLSVLGNVFSSKVSYVFSSLPLKTIDFTSDNGIATNLKIASKANLIVVSLGERGCMVVDGQNYNVIYEYKSDQFLSAVGVTSDAKYIFLSYNNSLAMFEFANQKSFILQSSTSFNNCVILDIIITQNNQFMFVAGEKGMLAVYSIANPQVIFKIVELKTSATLINRINFSKDEKFLFVGNNELGFTLIKLTFNQSSNIENSIILQLVGSAKPYWKIFQCKPTQDLKYVYCTDYWYGVYMATLDDVLSQSESNYPIEINFKLRIWPISEINPFLVYSIELIKEDQFLIVSVRSLGIYIFDITDKQNLILYQKIFVSGQPVQLMISPIDGNIIYVNKIQLNIYKQTLPNLNDDKPNLFNGHQSMIVSFYPQVFYRWRCYLSEDNQYFYGTQDYMGLLIAYLPNKDPYKIQQKYLVPATPPNFTEATTITKNKKYIFQAVQEDKCALKIIDISDLNNVKIIDCLSINEPTQHAEEQAISDDETILVISYDEGILIFDVSIPTSVKKLSYWKMEGLMIGNLAGVMITKNKKWILGTVRGYGLCALNIEDPINPLFTDSINTQGGEGIIASPYNEKLAYLTDGYRGVAVIDLSQLPKLQILSRISLRGWTNFLTVLKNDQFLLVSTMDDGQLTLIDSSDPNNLQIISMFQEEEESSQSSCFTSDFKYAFINNEYGTRIVPLNSQIIIHTQISQFVVNQNNFGVQQISLSHFDILSVGQNVQFDFISIYQKEGMMISDILYYDQTLLKIQSLPSWISVINNNFSVKFQVSKESLRSNISKPVQNTLLVKSALKLTEDNFIFHEDGFQTNLTIASQIFDLLLNKHLLIDHNGYVTDRFLHNKNITLTDLQLNDLNLLQFIQTKVKITLQFAVFYNPVIFFTQNSLLFDQNNKSSMIKSPSQDIKITIQFIDHQDTCCVFVNIPYSGCIQQLSSDQATIQLIGTTYNINNILFKQIIYHCKECADNINRKIELQIVDNLNYDYSNQFYIRDSIFLQQLKPISIKPKMNSLQQQFENQYPSSEIPIETDINFSFENNYFVQPQQNFLPITYTLYYYDCDNDNYTLANSNYWIKLEVNQLKFYGFASSEMFQTVEKLKIIASNGYDQSGELLKININQVSLLYALNIILRVFGILVGFIGLYKFKSYFFNAIINDKILYSDEFAIINQPFFKQITIIGDDYHIANLLFNQFKRKFFKGKIQFLNKQPKEQNKTTQESYNSYPMQVDSIKQSQLSCFNNNSQQNNIFNFNQIQQTNTNQYISKPQFQSTNLKSLLVSSKKNKQFQKMTSKIFKNLTNSTRKNLNEESEKNEKVKKWKQFQNRYICEKKGTVRIEQLISDMRLNRIAITFQKREYSVNSLKPILKNKNSVFFNCLKSIVCKYFISKDTKTFKLYKYLREYAKIYSKYSPSDWYKYYFEIAYYSSSYFNKQSTIKNIVAEDEENQKLDHKNNMIKNDGYLIQEAEEVQIFENPLPIFKLKEKLICQILYQNGIIEDNKKGLDQVLQKKINPCLLTNVLLSDAMGLYNKKLKSLVPSLGESLHCFPHQVKSIQASYLIPSQNYCFQSKDKKNYQPFSLETKLPKWLNVKCIKNALVFFGTPNLSDEKVILIKIMNHSNIIIRKFRICLLEELNNSFTKIEKTRKKTLLQPVYASYFHEIQKSLSDAEFEEKSLNNLSEKNQEIVDPEKVFNDEDLNICNNFQKNFISLQKISNEVEENEVKFKQLAQSFFLQTDPYFPTEEQKLENQQQINQQLPTKQLLEFVQAEVLQASQTIDPIQKLNPYTDLDKSDSILDNSQQPFQQNCKIDDQNQNFSDIPSEKQLPCFNN